MQLLVVGAGEMGRWFARHSGADAVAFADREPAVADAAARHLRETYGLDKGRDDRCGVDGDGGDRDRVDRDGGPGPVSEVPDVTSVSLETDQSFDAVCIAVPMGATPSAIAEHADRATAAVVDVSGEMRDAVAALREHASGLERASFHPLFSASNAPGNVPVVVDRPGPVVESMCASLSAAGNRVFETSPGEHDEAMETVQAKVHAALLAFALAADPVDERFHTALSAPFQNLVGEVLDGQPGVYADIQERFEGADAVAEAATALANGDRETFIEHLERARR